MTTCPPNNSTFTCVQAYATAIPTWFDPHAWLFAFLIIGACIALIFAFYSRVGTVIEIRGSAFIYLLFVGAITGSLIDAMLNIISYGLIVIILFAFGLYIYRSRN